MLIPLNFLTLLLLVIIMGMISSFVALKFFRLSWRYQVLVMSGAVVMLLCCGVFIAFHYMPRQFSSEAWKRAGELYREEKIPRVYDSRVLLVEDLLATHSFKRMSRDEVVQLLGSPDFEKRNKKGELDFFLYGLTGYSRRWPFPHDDALYFHFNKKQQVKHLSIKGSDFTKDYF